MYRIAVTEHRASDSRLSAPTTLPIASASLSPDSGPPACRSPIPYSGAFAELT
jgi:hypothetical protein